MSNNHSTLTALFTAIANSIRGKTGGTDPIVADTFPGAIDAIPDLVSSTADATAPASHILDGDTAYVKGEKVEGTMPNRGAVSAALNAGESVTIPGGYHNGEGKVTANSLASQTDGDAVAGDIMNGKTAWVDGVQVTGSMPNKGAVSQVISAGGSYTIPAGYHNGSGKVTANPVSSAFTTATLSTTTSIGVNATETKFTLPKSGLVIGSTLFFGAIKTNAVHKCTASSNTQGAGTASRTPSVSGTTLTFPAGGGKSGLAMGKSFVVSVTIYYIA